MLFTVKPNIKGGPEGGVYFNDQLIAVYKDKAIAELMIKIVNQSLERAVSIGQVPSDLLQELRSIIGDVGDLGRVESFNPRDHGFDDQESTRYNLRGITRRQWLSGKYRAEQAKEL